MCKKFKPLFVLILLSGIGTQLPPYALGETQKEQSTFGTEELPGIPLVKHPVTLPSSVLHILSADVDVTGCLSTNPLPPRKPLASLFIGSEVHLDGSGERDLVIVPVPDYGCFLSATGIGIFWVFRKTANSYELVLKASGSGLSILTAKHCGHRDIQTGTIGRAGREFTTITFRFDAKEYRQYRYTTKQRR
jgi:hypothetical protein